MRLRALAKINLGLDVIGKREDGYHEVRMIMQTINMYDQLEIEKKDEPGISITTNLPFIPTDERNLVYKAAKLLMDEFDIQEGITVELQKFIPVAAGMAGGSSDAAAAFVGDDETCCGNWSGCTILPASRNRTCRGNRRAVKTSSAMPELLRTDWKTGDQCFN